MCGPTQNKPVLSSPDSLQLLKTALPEPPVQIPHSLLISADPPLLDLSSLGSGSSPQGPRPEPKLHSEAAMAAVAPLLGGWRVHPSSAFFTCSSDLTTPLGRLAALAQAESPWPALCPSVSETPGGSSESEMRASHSFDGPHSPPALLRAGWELGFLLKGVTSRGRPPPTELERSQGAADGRRPLLTSLCFPAGTSERQPVQVSALLPWSGCQRWCS